MIIGLTGGIGSGKTAVSDTFATLGIDVVDADIVARNVVTKGTSALSSIAERFGDEILLEDGNLNRQKLRSIVFANEEDKTWLNNLLHPLIRQSMLYELGSSTSPYCLLVAPLLIENKLEQFVDRILVVDVSVETQIKRTLNRDNSNQKEIEAIIASQVSRNERLLAADDVLDNDKVTLIELREKVSQLHQSYLTLSGTYLKD